MPKSLENVIGLTSDKLEVIKNLGSRKLKSGKSQRWVLCKCICGNTTECLLEHIRRKKNPRTSCGCKRALGEIIKHGYSSSKTYGIWQGMKARCDNPNSDYYYCYGGKGIEYSSEWGTFEGFLKDMGECPEEYSIERLDINKNYCKENCIWLPLKEQARNTSKTKLTYELINEIREFYKSCSSKKEVVDVYSSKLDISRGHVYKILSEEVWIL